MVDGSEFRRELNSDQTHDRCLGVCHLEGQDIAAEMVPRGVTASGSGAGDTPARSERLRRRAQGSARVIGCPGTCRAL
jgi:hypothetical protein